MMDVLTTRNLAYLHESGKESEVSVTVFVPVMTEKDDWKCEFQLIPPNIRKVAHAYGVDFLQALLLCLEILPSYLRLTPRPSQAHWQGMPHCGFPSHVEQPADYQPPDIGLASENPGNLEVLTTRLVGCPDPQGVVRALQLTVYKPLQTADGLWRCAFSFAVEDDKLPPVRYGTGEDFIEAFLDALALARATYETMVPKGWEAPQPETLLDCLGFPYKIGRAFYTDPGKPFPGMPDFFPSTKPQSE